MQWRDREDLTSGRHDVVRVAGVLDLGQPSIEGGAHDRGSAIPGYSTVATGPHRRAVSKHHRRSCRRCGLAKRCALLPRAAMSFPSRCLDSAAFTLSPRDRRGSALRRGERRPVEDEHAAADLSTGDGEALGGGCVADIRGMRVVEQHGGGVFAEGGHGVDTGELGHEPAEEVPVLLCPGDPGTGRVAGDVVGDVSHGLVEVLAGQGLVVGPRRGEGMRCWCRSSHLLDGGGFGVRCR